MNDYTDLLPILQILIAKGMVERQGDEVYLTAQGRTAALLRWRGLLDDAKILFGLYLKEKYDKDKGGQ